MKNNIYILILILSLQNTLIAQLSPKNDTLNIGKSLKIQSSILQEERILNVYLPSGYDTSKCDVIYLLDGSKHEDFLHIVGLVQFFELQLNMPKTIVIGIENVDRKRDFTFPTELKEIKEKYPTTGKSEAFIECLEKEIIPLVKTKFNCTERRYLIGQSLGGLLASEVLLKKPTLFTDYIIVSPSLWWDNESMFKERDKLLQEAKNTKTRTFIAVGKEGRIMEREAKGLYASLTKLFKKDAEVTFHYFPKENHATVFHLAVYEALKWNFPFQE